ncbi:8-oxo-dGTP pyrophosphatase MutT (NUDIX family) [Streptomyces sp. 840.1]|uniref:NUDIX domain-containing protein n=1 Tax=Streptomyces sp. 840.1 TaxID=2485152 RepID=UPI000FBB36FF|nr:NUDIX hydrolase [Streptomyces sp. 840.1]ROQ63125.1 8-oxo-dGTP pyrophosphatase MutT (NUDIX family) [Streptomyces sp. 840.1]
MAQQPTPDDLPGSSMTDEEYGALRASAALWAGTSVLITNTFGHVLVQHVDYLATCLLPGGGVDAGESPAHGAARELMEELGVTAVIDQGLAVDWISADSTGAAPAVRFPGEILHVFDGGTWDDARISEIRLPPSEITGVEFIEPARLPELLAPSDARRALSALRARINAAGTVLLANGLPIAPTVLDRLGVLRTARPVCRYPWHDGATPQDLTVKQVWGWLFAPDVMQALRVSNPEVSRLKRRRRRPLCPTPANPASGHLFTDGSPCATRPCAGATTTLRRPRPPPTPRPLPAARRWPGHAGDPGSAQGPPRVREPRQHSHVPAMIVLSANRCTDGTTAAGR